MVYPIVAIVFGCIQWVCRWIYVFGYRKGPIMRAFGGLPINLSLLGMLVMSIVAMSKWIADIPSVI